MVFKSMFIAYVALISLVSMSESDPLTETGFSTDLIHRDSPQSPSYDPSLSPSQRIVNAMKRSLNRAKRFKPKRSKHTPESDVFYSGGDYLMKYSVGNPPVPSLGIADTGSDVIWTQCRPCLQCFNQSLPLFNPKLSRTYRKVRCNTTQCHSLQEAYCSNKNCEYSETYGDNSFTYGELARDTFALASTGKKKVSIPQVVFGCGFKNGGIFSGSESGIVGLGGGKASFVRQLGRLAQGKFSYCLVPVTADKVRSSKLHFGANAKVSGRRAVSTPLIKKFPETYYFLTMEGISVGNQRLEMSDSGHYEEGNMIIDSGTTLTVLPSEFYDKLEMAVKRLFKLKQIEDPERQLNLCYFARNDTRVRVPEITVHFKGADLKLKKDNIFVRTTNDTLCLAAKPTQNIAIYGNLAQANFLVGYDLRKMTVTFKPADCRKS